MCVFGGGPAQPTVSASESAQQVGTYAPVQRPDSPVAQLYRVRAMGTTGATANIARQGHLRNKRRLTNPDTKSKTLKATGNGAPPPSQAPSGNQTTNGVQRDTSSTSSTINSVVSDARSFVRNVGSTATRLVRKIL